MKVRVVYKSWLPGLWGATASTLYPFVFISAPKASPEAYALAKHEVIHVRQIRKLGWLRFYFPYARQWARSILTGRSSDDAYLAISYEQEAYAGQTTNELAAEERAEFGL